MPRRRQPPPASRHGDDPEVRAAIAMAEALDRAYLAARTSAAGPRPVAPAAPARAPCDYRLALLDCVFGDWPEDNDHDDEAEWA